MAELAVIGNVALDRVVRPDGSRSARLGGAALHIALSAADAGLFAATASVIGTDLAGLRCDPRLAVIDLSAIVTLNEASASFTLTYDERGELTRVDADYAAARHLTRYALTRIQSGADDAFHVCCRRPLDIPPVLDALVRRHAAFSVDVFLPSAAESIEAALPALPHAQSVFVNAAEYELLAARIPPETLPAILISDGPRPARLLRHGRVVASATPPVITPVDVTGAGDTLTGAFLAAKAAGAPDLVAVRRAVAAASRHVARPAIEFAI